MFTPPKLSTLLALSVRLLWPWKAKTSTSWMALTVWFVLMASRLIVVLGLKTSTSVPAPPLTMPPAFSRACRSAGATMVSLPAIALITVAVLLTVRVSPSAVPLVAVPVASVVVTKVTARVATGPA